MSLPPGTVDPMFQCELALELGMTLGELSHGRGTPMSAHELSVIWPSFFAARARERERAQRKAEQEASRR